MRISDWSSDVCSSDLGGVHLALVIALSLSISTPPPRPQTGMQVTFVELGDVPPNGDPNGDSAPPRPSEAEAIEAKEEPITPTDQPVVAEAEPVSEVQSEKPAPEPTVDGFPHHPHRPPFPT